jgi:protein involved in polysaccharide export with SLBB domain
MRLPIYAAARFGVRAGLALFLAVLFLAAGTAAVYAQTADTLDTNAKIKVVTAGEPTLSGDYTVDTNGDITMLYVNQVHVQGLTVAEAQKEITKQLAKYLRNPQVVVTLVSYGGITVDIEGAVTTQGPKLLRSDSHLNDVVQLAKPAVEADLTKVEVTHGRPGEAHSKDVVNYLSYLDNKTEAGNPLLRDGDSVYVPLKESLPIDVSVRGEVAKPGRLSVQAKSTVLDALEQAGGVDQVNADRKNIVVQHSNGTETMFDYDAARTQPGNLAVNPVLKDGDAVDVKALVRASSYSITGGVAQPGEYPITDTPVTLADAIAKAKGAEDRAKLDKITIVRVGANGGPSQVLNINGKDVAVQAKTMIQPGDNITVPPGSPPSAPMDPLRILTIVSTVIGLGRVFK